MEELPQGHPQAGDGTPPRECFDRQGLLAHVEGDWSLLREIVELFRDEYPRLIQAARAAIAAHDGRGLARTAHTLKGAVGNFCAPLAVAEIQQLECWGKSGNFPAASHTLQAVEQSLALLTSALSEWLTTRDHP